MTHVNTILGKSLGAPNKFRLCVGLPTPHDSRPKVYQPVRLLVLYFTTAVSALLLALRTEAGTLTVNGNLAVTTNLTAQSITLGGVTATNWAASLSGGYKYVVVAEGTNDVQRGNNLQAAYSTATTLGPTSSNRVAVIVPPGSYNLGSSSFTLDASYLDLIGLVPA